MRNTVRVAVTLAAALSLGGCGILFPSAASRAGRDTPGFRAGYSDGCASANSQDTNYRNEQVRDEAAYASDKHYRSGWASGFSSCRTTRTRDPSRNPTFDNNPGGRSY